MRYMKLQTVFWKEDDMYIIKEVVTGVTTQGNTMEEALANLKEAVSLYVEEMPDAREMLTSMNTVGAVSVEIP
ncbi:MAG: type II toxin-antitoxin system HicB family antitoxin [Nitrosopumilales archaeon CG15_BIG_FIL_POST_REV_8_21_14_020_33_23]|nr:MAG: HicB family protein [Nitrosopumilales archaeon CG11_big_fil_rev_8_21_14_0_20_33_24]PIN97532.1 MAG: type II toxin-antitoxin system HicB family antitoxin [Nitrosopumilus sp. CG10_big_fil_rev_8_21_14_0_10_33_7]PIW34306.1 MAG: type II toxin-antitoxin system HicB family antitoxin [Nitrosopumilales archaeon CG15_BIG_FIL_POST_REV_8_21_14_020_33_23]